METRRLIIIAILIALIPSLNVRAQVAGAKHFDKDGLEFDYPNSWKIAEGKGEESQYAELATESKSTQLIVSWQFGAILDCEWQGARMRVTQALVERVANQIHAEIPSGTSWQEIKLGKTRTDQIHLSGQLNNIPVIADVYSLGVKHQFLNLVFLRAAADQNANAAWETIRTTLKITPLDRLVKGKASDQVLNGKAIRLPRPDYPAEARNMHASGTVVVQVLINETGYVIAACAVSGNELLRDPSVAAARGARFSPTKLSGKPVRVTGLITYNFVRQ